MEAVVAQAKLENLEERIAQAGPQQAMALQEINEERLYKVAGFETFENYCDERWGFTRQRAYQLIDFARVHERCQQIVDIPVGSESHARELARLPADQQPDAWKEVIAEAKGERITARLVEDVVSRWLGDVPPENVPIIHDIPLDGVTDDLSTLMGQKFGTIYADPPWAYSNKATRSAVEDIYAGTMSIEEICAMPVAELAADDAHLHLWTTNGFLREAFDVIDAWGFEYRSCFVWAKPQMGIGNYWRVSHEFMLLGIRGDAKRFNERKHKSWAEISRQEHSEKPEEIRGIIERVSPGPYLELFGRKQIHGWTVFGNQVNGQQRTFV